jgi:hypothetical protein
MSTSHTGISYAEFQRLLGEYTDHIMAATIRHERNRPEPELTEAKVAAVNAQNALWDAIRGEGDKE